MKNLLLFWLLITFLSISSNAVARGQTGGSYYGTRTPTHVNGYTKRNGTYIQPHYRTPPNNTKLDNWSTKGNVNPYTGKAGTKNP